MRARAFIVKLNHDLMYFIFSAHRRTERLIPTPERRTEPCGLPGDYQLPVILALPIPGLFYTQGLLMD